MSVKQGGIKYHFYSLWYDATWDWTQVSRTIGEHSTYKAKPKKKVWYAIKTKKPNQNQSLQSGGVLVV